MKIVIDACMSPAWIACLAEGGHDAVHWSTLGDPRAKDRTVMAWAVREGRIVLTNDLDFGAILAATGATSPSVLQIRTEDVLPDTCGARVLAAPRRFGTEIELGALISVDARTDRARILPIRGSSRRPE